ncbi:MAG: hypothetical protein CMP23_00400 [Rickettsiales bacterium]|nr:hypothetical protein [Rickettsiales bacterium]
MMEPWVIERLERERRKRYERNTQSQADGQRLNLGLAEQLWMKPELMGSPNEKPAGTAVRGVWITEL